MRNHSLENYQLILGATFHPRVGSRNGEEMAKSIYTFGKTNQKTFSTIFMRLGKYRATARKEGIEYTSKKRFGHWWL